MLIYLAMYFPGFILTEVTCQRKNGGCDHMCSDIISENRVNCSCRGGYQLVGSKSCTGTQDNVIFL